VSISVLKGTRNTEECGIITEAMAVASYKYYKEMYVYEQMTYRLRDVESVKVLTDILNKTVYNQYNTFSAIDEIYKSTVGIIKNAANQRSTFEALYESSQKTIGDFFSVAKIFERN
jgi:hypothetical protein